MFCVPVQLAAPVPVKVLEGRVRGDTRVPISTPIPKYNEEIGAYLMPDGMAVAVSKAGQLTRIPRPDIGDAGFDPAWTDGGLPLLPRLPGTEAPDAGAGTVPNPTAPRPTAPRPFFNPTVPRPQPPVPIR